MTLNLRRKKKCNIVLYLVKKAILEIPVEMEK